MREFGSRMTESPMHIKLERPDHSDVAALVAELDAYQATLYPPESRYSLDLESAPQGSVFVALARHSSGRAIACAALVLEPDYGELKRLYVRPEGRGAGVAKRLVSTLESLARVNGCTVLRLETGPLQPEALRLYSACGFRVRGRYGTYRDDPLSVFMEKLLGT